MAFSQWSKAFALVGGMVFSILSAPVHDELFQFRQPDGTMVGVIVTGDEFYQDVETPEGYSLVRDPKTDWICYAQLRADGSELTSTGIVYEGETAAPKKHAIAQFPKHARISGASLLQKRKTRFLELNGEPYEEAMKKFCATVKTATHAAAADTVYGLTILVDFPDQRSQVPRDSMVNWLNMTGYKGYRNSGSVRDFYNDMSVGKLVYLQQVSNFITAKYNKTHYDTGTGYSGSTTLINEICATFKAQNGFDFSKLTISGGYIQATNILYAGSPTDGWANGLWPHSGTLRYSFATGVQMSAHMLANIGTSLSLSTICHENGHMLCKFPDLYAYDNHSSGAGYYDIMSSTASSINPAPFGAFLRSLRGWMRLTDITKDAPGKLYYVPVNSDVAYTWSGSLTGSTQELFCIEARRRTGRSASLPDSGLIIWHIDKSGDNTTTGKNDYAVPEQADGKFDLENGTNSGNPGDLWRANSKTRFNDTTVPSSMWHTNAKSGIQIANVSKVKDTMTFSLGDVLTAIDESAPVKNTNSMPLMRIAPEGIEYRVESIDARRWVWVTLRLFALNGRLIATLVDGPQQVGRSYKARYSMRGKTAKRRGEGVYLCVLTAAGMKTSVLANTPYHD